MTTFKGLTDWFEIFRTGTWTDAAGNTRDWTAEDLDAIVSSYNPEADEAPLVIGHPETDAPAYGWVEGLKRVGEVLLARGKEVVSEFEDMVKQGLFKKRSVRLTPDGTRLLHVGFLGAAAPAVKGLKNIAFKGGEQGITIECAEASPWTFETIARMFRSLRDWLIEKEGKETADAIIPDWDVEYIKDEARAGEQDGAVFSNTAKPGKETVMSMKDSIKGLLRSLGVDVSKVPDDALPDDVSAQAFSEAEVAAREKAAADKAKKEAEDAKDREFAERQKSARIESRKAETREFIDKLKADGHIIPAWEKLGLLEFMQNLDGETEIEFAQGIKTSRLEFMKGFLSELPRVIDFKEIATRGQSFEADSAQEKLIVLAKKRAEEKSISFGDALTAVSKDNPALYKEYMAELGGPAE